MKTTRIVALTIPIAFLLMSFARPAAAMKPEITIISYIYEETIDCSAWNPEWTFQIQRIQDEEDRTVIHFDKNGDPDWIMFEWKWMGTAWSTVSGLTLKDDGHAVELWDLESNIVKWSGFYYHYTIPGKGNVFFDTGHQVFDLNGVQPYFGAGQHDMFDALNRGIQEGGDPWAYFYVAYCSALA